MKTEKIDAASPKTLNKEKYIAKLYELWKLVHNVEIESVLCKVKERLDLIQR